MRGRAEKSKRDLQVRYAGNEKGSCGMGWDGIGLKRLTPDGQTNKQYEINLMLALPISYPIIKPLSPFFVDWPINRTDTAYHTPAASPLYAKEQTWRNPTCSIHRCTAPAAASQCSGTYSKIATGIKSTCAQLLGNEVV